MPRFRLTQPHALELGPQRTALYVETGTVIDTAELPAHFQPSPLMAPLDPEAATMLQAVIDRIRATAGPGSVPVVGPLHHLPGGDVYEAQQRRRETTQLPGGTGRAQMKET
jgi:hypothetical protein